MKYNDVRTFLAKGLESAGYQPLPLFNPGPSSDLRMQKLAPGRMVFIAIGDGRGFTKEQLFDSPFIRIRTVGPQGKFAEAEQLAMDVDKVLCSVVGNTMVGDALTLYINRAGGAPSLLSVDAGERYHYACTYITETVTGF